MREFTIFDLAKGNSTPQRLQEDSESFAISLALVPNGTAGSGGLQRFMGPCAVIDLISEDNKATIDADEMKTALKGLITEVERIRNNYYPHVETPTRLLIKTRGKDDQHGRIFSTEALDAIVADGYTLLGVDTQSLDPPFQSDNLEYARQQKLPCLLNLELGEIDAGFLYTLMAPPMALENQDLVPVRPLLMRS